MYKYNNNTTYFMVKDIFKRNEKKYLNNNQNRLYLDFHYPRSHKTIQESKNGYKKYIKKFNYLSSAVMYLDGGKFPKI